MRLRRQFMLLLIALTLITVSCKTLPDVKPFADSTTALASAAGTHYSDIASDVASLKAVKMAGEKQKAYEERKNTLKDTQKIFEETDKNLNTLFGAMTTYSEKVVSLAAAGNTGAEAAQSILDSAQGFAQLGSMSGLPLGTAAGPITKGFKAIADEFTKMQAKKSLKETVAAAQPGVDLVAKQFEVIYGEATTQAANSIRNTKRGEASEAAGPSIIGFNDVVMKNYNDYYRHLLSFVKMPESNQGESSNERPSTPTWRGFCRNIEGPCQAKEELEAVGVVEARMEAILPIVNAYKTKVDNIEAILKHRQETSKAVIKAVKAWALEHEKLRRCLDDGTSLSAFNLKAAVIELYNLLIQKP